MFTITFMVKASCHPHKLIYLNECNICDRHVNEPNEHERGMFIFVCLILHEHEHLTERKILFVFVHLAHEHVRVRLCSFIKILNEHKRTNKRTQTNEHKHTNTDEHKRTQTNINEHKRTNINKRTEFTKTHHPDSRMHTKHIIQNE